MTDPIATSSISIVVDDPEHVITMAITTDSDGSPGLLVNLSLAVRSSMPSVPMSRLAGSFSLSQAAQEGIIDPASVPVVRSVLVALGQKLAADAGMVVT